MIEMVGRTFKTIDVEELKTLEDKTRRIILHVRYNDRNNRLLALDELMKIRNWLKGLGIELSELKRKDGD